MFSDFVDYVMADPAEPYYIGWQTGKEASPPEGKVHWTDKKSVHFETAHSVAIVGFGVTTQGTQYWIIRNSWGGSGYLKIVRGRNVSGIESSVEAPRVYGSDVALLKQFQPVDDVTVAVSVVLAVFIIVVLYGVYQIRR